MIVHKSQSYDLKDPNSLSNFISDTIKLIKAIPLVSLQSVALKLLSKPSGISENQLYDMLKQTHVEQPRAYVAQEKKEQEQIAKNEVSRDFFKTPMRKLMAFIIQQPTVVSNVQREFALDEFVALCKRLGVKGADELEGLLKIIAKTPDITPAKFIEQTRQTAYEKIVRLLISAPLNLTFESGGEIREIPYVDRIEYFADILSEVITKPLKDRAKILSVEMSQGKMDALSEYTQIQKEILSKDLKS